MGAATPRDRLELSPAARTAPPAGQASNAVESTPGASELTPEQDARVQELKRRDAEVRTHEQAHLAAAGPHARGGPSFEFERGPDGRLYAVSGEVDVDTSEVPDDPAATIAKMNQVISAALAPASPSGQDRAVAAAAAATRAKAQAEMAQGTQEIGSEANSEPMAGTGSAQGAPSNKRAAQVGMMIDERA